MREIPKPGQIYRHFKGNLYQIVAIARHSETLEALVIYQALYGDFEYFARPLHMFMDELDKEKYRGVTQRDRFELVRTVMDEIELEPLETYQEEEIDAGYTLQEDTAAETEHTMLDEGIEQFLDAKSFEEKLRIFTGVKHRLTNDMVNLLAAAMDTEVLDGSLEERVESLNQYLLTQVKYECSRLR